MNPPTLSIILLAYNMQRELPKTLQSLSNNYQTGANTEDYEVILIENKSNNLLDGNALEEQYSNLRYFLNETNPSSPSYAMNLGLKYARGSIVAFCIDGARLLSPGIVKGIINASLLFNEFVVATHAYHLGSEPQNKSVPEGRYNKVTEDALLGKINWPSAGYQLFNISVLALSSGGGWFNAIAESNCIALPKNTAIKMGGYCERFVTLGGGYANLDFYKRAQQTEGSQLVYLLGEGSFHQVHGGVATNRNDTPHDQYKQEYKRIRNKYFEMTELPANVYYMGSINVSSSNLLKYSAQKLIEKG